MKKNHRTFLFVLILVLVVALAACGGGSNKDEAADVKPVELKISTQVPGTHNWVSNVLEPLAEDIEDVTEGRVTAIVHSGGALGDSSAQYDSAKTGIADLAVGLHGYHPGDFPISEVVELPFMANSSIQGTKTLWSLYENVPEVAEVYEGVKVVALFTADPNIILTANDKVSSVADLKNMKIRSPAPVINEVLETFGAVPVSIPNPDTYEAMHKNVVDGAITGTTAVPSFKLNEVTNFVTKNAINTTSFYMVMNEDTWEKISQEDQAALDEIFGEALSMEFAKDYTSEKEKAWETIEESEIEISDLSEGEKSKWKDSLQHINEDWIDKVEEMGKPGQEIYDDTVRFSEEFK